jgi:GT2 family glycosyltransferase
MEREQSRKPQTEMKRRCCVVVLNFNGEKLLPACLESLERQTAEVFDTQVVDNASTDGSAALVAEKYSWARFVALEENYGFTGANNLALTEAQASGYEFVLLLNNDTFAASTFMAEMLAMIESDPKIAAVCPKIYFAKDPHRLWYGGGEFSLWTGVAKHRGWKQLDSNQFDSGLDITQATGCAMLVRVSAMREVGLLDNQFGSYAEDLDWSVRFIKQGYRIAFAPKAHLWHLDGASYVTAVGNGSQERRQFLSTRNMIFVARKHVRWWQVPTHAVGFLLRHVAFFTAVRIWRRDFRALAAIYRGIAEGLSTPLVSRTDAKVEADSLRA